MTSLVPGLNDTTIDWNETHATKNASFPRFNDTVRPPEETITFPPYTPTSSAVPRHNIPSLEASFPQQSWPNESVAALAAVAGVAATLLVVWALQLRQKRAKVMTREGSDDSISPPDYVCAGSPIGTAVTLPASSSSYM
ncbi:hypothetical protein H257_06843 [Aphanomyces astaci]|uniref:Uncharacterized protein n=1 Tax=Aphanomyces astaci TaxID=112090 RepID=W4GKP3_APHAT|nr:hypothetical protein H257_06843 [Aphanomyces astaci]ETV79584.1 hypothetical protein H257_06843 [Aphanomyces astaci]|eukprot:XP_009830520.1 hypothetical protein H257_06843 [Aphanomyces astaci]